MSGCIGLTDKLYWRLYGWAYHCFAPADGRRRRRYEALCSSGLVITRSGGQAIRCPPEYARCARCDRSEMQRRGWTESGPESDDWRDP